MCLEFYACTFLHLEDEVLVEQFVRRQKATSNNMWSLEQCENYHKIGAEIESHKSVINQS